MDSCGRYLWASFDLDDTLSATVDPDGGDGRGDVQAFAVAYDAIAGIGDTLMGSKSSPNVHLAWDASPNATSYIVQRCLPGSGKCTFGTIGTTTNTYYDAPVLLNGVYCWYQIEAVNGNCTAP